MTTREPNGKLANRSYLFDATGKNVANYDKIHLFDTGVVGGNTSTESEIYAPGDRAVVVDTPVGKLGLTICSDVRFPHLYRDLAKAGRRSLRCRPRSCRSPAPRFGTFCCARVRSKPAVMSSHRDRPARTGRDTQLRPFADHRSVGRRACDAGEEVGYITADVDLDHLRTVRGKILSLSHDRPFAPHRPDMSLRAGLVRWHRRIALGAALFLLVQFLSGTVLVFREQIVAATLPVL